MFSDQVKQPGSFRMIRFKIEDKSPLLDGVFVLAGVFEGVSEFQVQRRSLRTFVDG